MKALQCVELGGVDKLEINEVSSPDVGTWTGFNKS